MSKTTTSVVQKHAENRASSEDIFPKAASQGCDHGVSFGGRCGANAGGPPSSTRLPTAAPRSGQPWLSAHAKNQSFRADVGKGNR